MAHKNPHAPKLDKAIVDHNTKRARWLDIVDYILPKDTKPVRKPSK